MKGRFEMIASDKILIDYLTFTVKCNKGLLPNFNNLIECMGLDGEFDSFQKMGGLMFYENTYRYNGIVVALPKEGREDMGICFSMSGNGCRYFESIVPLFVWSKFFLKLIDYCKSNNYIINFSRVDLCVDDYSGNLELGRIKRHLQKGLWVASARSYERVKMFEKYDSKGTLIGDTVYIGSKKSDRFIRIYNKTLEQQGKGLVEVPPNWNRLECVFKGKFANSIIASIVELGADFGGYFSRLLNGQLRFIRKRESHITSSPVARFWVDFVGTIDRYSLSIDPAKPTLFRMKQFILNQCSATLISVLSVCGEEFLVELLKKGVSGLRARHLNALNRVDVPSVKGDSFLNSIPSTCLEYLEILNNSCVLDGFDFKKERIYG